MPEAVDIHTQNDLLARLTSGYRNGDRFVFMLGTGVTIPVGEFGGVPGTAGVLELVLEIFKDDPEVLSELKNESNSARAYQRAFRALHARRGPRWANHIIRCAVLQARARPESQAAFVDFLKDPASARDVQFTEICAALERDAGWVLRPGLEAFGQIAAEFRESFGTTVLTTNFDPLITVAIRRAKGRTLKTVLPIDGSPSLASAPDSTHVVHIHGDWSGLDTLHSDAILATNRPQLENYIRGVLSNATIVVLGYGGWNDSFMRSLQNATRDPQSPFNVLWAFRSAKQSDDVIARLSQSAGKSRVVFYADIDADVFLVNLRDRLQLGQRRGPVEKPPSPPLTEKGETARPPKPVVTKTRRARSALGRRQVLRENRFLEFLVAKGAKLQAGLSEDQKHTVQEPNFLLFERAGQIIMTIAPTEEGIDLDRLQRTDWPRVRSRALTADEVVRLGFPHANVHPMFRDPGGLVSKIFWDADLLVQSILFPNSEIALPIYRPGDTAQKLVAPIAATLEALITLHGRDKLEFANVQARGRKHGWMKWRNQILRHLLESSPFHTRFAPTPSNSLHLGNARTAIATYLLARGRSPAPSGAFHPTTEGWISSSPEFYLRFDDTDSKKLDIGNLTKIKDTIVDELRWLGIQLNEFKRFSQSATSSFALYAKVEQLLFNRGLVVRGAEGAVLSDVEDNHYLNVWVDWLEGPKVEHRPPQAVEKSTFAQQNKAIKIWRKPDEDPYYRFAGVIDDIRALNGERHLSYVLRDSRQQGLCREQAHIRATIERARASLGDQDVEDRNLLIEAGIDPDRPVSLPLYCLVQVVVVNRQALKKSKALEAYMIETLRARYTLPESVTAYVTATLLPPGKLGWSQHLRSIASAFGLLGVKAGLDYHADLFSLEYLTRTHDKYECKLALARIAIAERIVLRCMPYWIFVRRVKQHVASAKVDERIMARLYDNLGEMASWSQVMHLLSGPRGGVRLSTREIEPIRAILEESDETAMVTRLQAMRAAVRTENDHALRNFHSVLANFRRVLVGDESSPKIEVAITILGVQKVRERLDNVVPTNGQD